MTRTPDILTSTVQSFTMNGMIVNNYPMLLEPGIPRGWIHSLVISHMVVLGHSLGYISIADIGIFNRSTQVLTRDTSIKRPDPVWISRDNKTVDVIIEVESKDLIKKVKHLMKFSEHIASSSEGVWPRICCLIWWGSWNEDIWIRARKMICRGFHEDGIIFTPSPNGFFLILQLIFGNNNTNLRYKGANVIDVITHGITKSMLLRKLQSHL